MVLSSRSRLQLDGCLDFSIRFGKTENLEPHDHGYLANPSAKTKETHSIHSLQLSRSPHASFLIQHTEAIGKGAIGYSTIFFKGTVFNGATGDKPRMVSFRDLSWILSLIRQFRLSAVKVVFFPVFSALWHFLRSIVSMFFYILREHFRDAMERAVIHLGHFLIHLAVVFTGAWILVTGIGKFASYTCSFSVLSRMSVCYDLSLSSPDAVVAPLTSAFPIVIDPRTRTYDQILDESAHGAPLALNLMKAERLVVEMINEVGVGPLSTEFKHGFLAMFSGFSEEALDCQTELETLDSAAVGSLLRWVRPALSRNHKLIFFFHRINRLVSSNKLAMPVKLSGGPPKYLLAWGGIGSFLEWSSKREWVGIPMSTPVAPDSPDFKHMALQVDNIIHALQRLQNMLVDLHQLISVERARVASKEESILASWTFLGKKDKTRQCQLSQNFLMMIDLHRKGSLAHIDGIAKSLRSYRLDITDVVSASRHDSCEYQLFRLQHSIQRLGYQPLVLPQPTVTRGAAEATVPIQMGEV